MYPSPELSCSSFRRLGVVVAAISVLTVHGQTSIKELDRVLPATSAHWVGNGFLVHPVFADLAFTNTLSPFLMLVCTALCGHFCAHIYILPSPACTACVWTYALLSPLLQRIFARSSRSTMWQDYAAPKSFGPSLSERRGVGTHPHRGFETVTIAYQGEVEHADSQRNRDIIGPGDVQWMTAASGIIHEVEYPPCSPPQPTARRQLHAVPGHQLPAPRSRAASAELTCAGTGRSTIVSLSQEYHSTAFTKRGGIFEMVQLWVNLPRVT